MTVRKPRNPPGKALVATLNASLPDGGEWDEQEQVLLGLIESAADRAGALKALLDVELGSEQVSTRRVTEVAAEVRQLEQAIAKWASALDPKMVQTKSLAHQHAANTRWANRG